MYTANNLLLLLCLLDNFRAIKNVKNLDNLVANENVLQKSNNKPPSKVEAEDMKEDTEAKEMGWWDFLKDKVQKTLLPSSPQGGSKDHPHSHGQSTVAHVEDNFQATEDEKKQS